MSSNNHVQKLKYNKEEKNPEILEQYFAQMKDAMTKEQLEILLDARQEQEELDSETLSSAQALFETWVRNKGEKLENSMNSLIKSVRFFDPKKLNDTDLQQLKDFHNTIQTETKKLSPKSQVLFSKTIQSTMITIKGNKDGDIQTQMIELLKSIRYKLAYAAAVTVAGGGNKIAHIMQKYPTSSGVAVCGLAAGKWIASQLLYGYFYGTVVPDMASTQSEMMCGNSTMVGGVRGMKKGRKTIKRSPVFTMKRKSSKRKSSKRKRKSSKRKSSKRKSSKRKSSKY